MQPTNLVSSLLIFILKEPGNASAMMYFYMEYSEEFAKKADSQLIEFMDFFFKDSIKKIGL